MVLNLFLLQTASPGSSWVGFLPILLIFAIFYFLLFLPMQRQRKQQARMLSELQNGNEVITSGGVVGTIVSIENDRLVIRVKPDNVKLQVTRSSVSNLVQPAAAEVKK